MCARDSKNTFRVALDDDRVRAHAENSDRNRRRRPAAVDRPHRRVLGQKRSSMSVLRRLGAARRADRGLWQARARIRNGACNDGLDVGYRALHRRARRIQWRGSAMHLERNGIQVIEERIAELEGARRPIGGGGFRERPTAAAPRAVFRYAVRLAIADRHASSVARSRERAPFGAGNTKRPVFRASSSPAI